MDIEAASQIAGVKQHLGEVPRDGGLIGFELRDVNISAALLVPKDTDEAARDLELHKAMALRRVRLLHHFVSLEVGPGHVHDTGSIRVTRSRKDVSSIYTTAVDAEGFDLWRQKGLCLGTQFRSLSSLRTDSALTRR